MATYKVIQDIEAEDKFVGPLTLKQFIFAMFGALFAYLTFFVVTKGITWGAIITAPPSLFGFFMAFPWSSEQPTDVWALAKIRFRLKPKKRIWDQAGLEELVTITAPKKEERPLGNNLSQVEVKSRLKALAGTLDSRGWIIKNSPLPGLADESSTSDDRLIGLDMLDQQVPEMDEASLPDMMEGDKSLDNMIEQSDQARKTQIYETMDRIRRGETPVETGQPEMTVSPPLENAADEQAAADILRARKQAGDIVNSNLHTIPSQPTVSASTTQDEESEGTTVEQKTEVEKAQASVTEQPVPDILELAQNNDLNVATIARQANKNSSDEQKEVVISLH